MRRSVLLAVLAVFALVAPCVAQQNAEEPAAQTVAAFEGAWRQTSTTVLPAAVSGLISADERDPVKVLHAVLAKLDSLSDGSTLVQEQLIRVKANRMRIDTKAGTMVSPAYGIFVGDSVFYALPSLSRVMVTSQRELGERARRISGADTTAPAVVDLGTRSVQAVTAHGYRLLWGTRVLEIWFDPSTRIPALPMTQFQAGLRMGVQPEWARALLARGFPLEQAMAMHAPAALGGGWMVNRLEVQRLLAQPVPDSLFVLPAGLERVPMPDVSVP